MRTQSRKADDAGLNPQGNSGIGLEGEEKFCLQQLRTLDDLLALAGRLDERPLELEGLTRGMVLAQDLSVRTRQRGIGKLVANAVQIEFELRRGPRNIVLKARQLGMTTWTAARFFLRTITQKGVLTLQVAHTQEAAEEIFRIVRRFYDHLPLDLRTGPLKTSRANVRQIVLPELDSQYLVMTAGDRNVGRGLTVQNLHCSELARWPGDPAETLAGLRASLASGAELILESTPMGVGGCFYDEWHKARETGTVQHFFPWWLEPSYVEAPADPATLTEEEIELHTRPGVQLSLEQIGYRRQMRAGFGALGKQEYAEDAESCFRASGECFFEVEVLEELLKQARTPTQVRKNGCLEIWLRPQNGKRYLVAVDPAGGNADGDYSAMEILDMETGLQCAEYAAHVGGLELAREAAELAREYNGAWLVVERNNQGSEVLAYLKTDSRYERIYHEGGNEKNQAGWNTTPKSRPDALARLAAALVQCGECFSGRRFLGECRTFVHRSNGTPGAQSGTHDDRVMAMAIALAARAELLEKRRQ